jgi:threonine dehydrogenase-like Zn-dependent dehydrogenase
VSVEDTLKLKAGETILIQGGAGGVASFAVQLAKDIGARVITTASAANHAYLRSIGADQIIDYNAQDFTKAVSGCDAVFDTVGGDVTQKSFAVLSPAAARPLSPPVRRRPNLPAATCNPSDRTLPATVRIWNASLRSMPREPYAPPKSPSSSSRRQSPHTR